MVHEVSPLNHAAEITKSAPLTTQYHHKTHQARCNLFAAHDESEPDPVPEAKTENQKGG